MYWGPDISVGNKFFVVFLIKKVLAGTNLLKLVPGENEFMGEPICYDMPSHLCKIQSLVAVLVDDHDGNINLEGVCVCITAKKDLLF